MIKFVEFELKKRYKTFFLLLFLFLIENIYFYHRFKFEPLVSVRRDFFFANFALNLGAITAFIFFRNYIYIKDLLMPKPGYMILMTKFRKSKILISEYFFFLLEFFTGLIMTFSIILWQGNRVGLFESMDKKYLSLVDYIFKTPDNYLLQKFYLYNFSLFIPLTFALSIFVLILLKVIERDKVYTKFKIGVICVLFFLTKAGLYKFIFQFKNIDEYLYGSENLVLISRSVPIGSYFMDILITLIIVFLSAVNFERKLDI